MLKWNRSNLDKRIFGRNPRKEELVSRIRRRVTVNGRQIWVTANTEQEYAENLMRAMGAKEPPKKHIFSQYADEWFRTYSKPNVETATAVTYERQLRLHLKPFFGKKFVEDISSKDVQEFFSSMSGAKETKMKVRMVLNMIFGKAEEDGVIQRNPLRSRSVRIQGRNPKETEPYSVEQMRFIVSRIGLVKKAEDRGYLALQAMHPLRLEEVLGLKGNDISNGTIRVRRSVTHPTRNKAEVKEPKTESSYREISIVPGAENYIPKVGPNEFVIGGKEPMSYTRLRRMLERIRKDIGFEETLSPRRFRTTVLTDIYDQTKDILATQKAAGHATADMTLRHYVKGRMHEDRIGMDISRLYVTGV